MHLATHACLDYENADYSRIFFHDGSMTTVDIQSQEINTDLTVISACESGAGNLVKGEGAMSLAKGFFHAGSKSTVVSLWPVDDCSTADFMTHFYGYLRKGYNKSKALQQAKIKYVEDAHPSRTHPYYWAGFILIGDNSAIWQVNDMAILLKSNLLPIAVLLLSSLAFLFVWRRTINRK